MIGHLTMLAVALAERGLLVINAVMLAAAVITLVLFRNRKRGFGHYGRDRRMR